MAVTAKQWADDLLGTLKVKPTAPDEQFIENWLPMEGTAAKNNPMATTLGSRASGVSVPGSTYFNPQGVQNYPTYAAGLGATASTLEESRYGSIMGALRSGNPYTYGNQSSLQSEFRTWSGQGYSGVSSGTSPSYVSPGLAAAFSKGTRGSIATSSKPTSSSPKKPGTVNVLTELTSLGHSSTPAPSQSSGLFGISWTWILVILGVGLLIWGSRHAAGKAVEVAPEVAAA